MGSFTREEFGRLVGQEIGISDWNDISQVDVNQFATCTGDDQYIHTDPERARQTPFGGTIAHGLLTLSILAPLQRTFTHIQGTAMTVNYGFNRIRFMKPVPVGARIRGRFVLNAFDNLSPTEARIAINVTAELKGSEKPAMVAELILVKRLSD